MIIFNLINICFLTWVIVHLGKVQIVSASHLFHAGTWVTRLLAKDADDPTTPNAMLVYRLGEQKPTSAFVVNSLTGDVTSLTWLDREVGIHYFLPLLFEL